MSAPPRTPDRWDSTRSSYPRHGPVIAAFPRFASIRGAGRDPTAAEAMMRVLVHSSLSSTLLVAATTILMGAAATPSHAGVDADVRAGVFTGVDAVGVGAGF